MSIVRELLIKIGFKTEKTEINNANKAILGFKSKFALVGNAVVDLTSKVLQFAREVSGSIIATDNLARSIGTTYNSLKASQKAASQLANVTEDQFNSAIKKSSELIKGFQRGDGVLKKLALEFNLDFDGLESAEELFVKILKTIGKFDKDTKRIEVAKAFFGEGGENELADLSRKTAQFISLSKSNENNKLIDDDTVKNAKEFSTALNGLIDNLKGLGVKLANTLFPPISWLIKALEYSFDLFKSIFTFDFKLFVESVTSIGMMFDNLFYDIKQYAIKAGEAIKAMLPDWLQKRMEDRPFANATAFTDPTKGFGSNTSQNNTYNTEIIVSPGTSEQVAKEISTAFEQNVREATMNDWINIRHNLSNAER